MFFGDMNVNPDPVNHGGSEFMSSNILPFFEDDEDNTDLPCEHHDAVYKTRMKTVANMEPFCDGDVDNNEDEGNAQTGYRVQPDFPAEPVARGHLGYYEGPTHRTPEGASDMCNGIKRVRAADLEGPESEVGCGGERGSRVFRVLLSPKLKSELMVASNYAAHKVYPTPIVENEMAFIRIMQSTLFHGNGLTRDEWPHTKLFSGAAFAQEEVPSDAANHLVGLCHLVLPFAVVVHNDDEDLGVLMPLYDFSLKGYLLSRFSEGTPRRSICESFPSCLGREKGEGGEGFGEGPRDLLEAPSSFLSELSYDPVGSIEVITAIAFQILQSIVMLNHRMGHVVNDVRYHGFTHNDLHTGNILLSREGRVALCDFELVSHSPPSLDNLRTQRRRLPPYSRQSPHGIFCATSDTWAFGLLLVSLLTGVDPLLSSEALIDDFGPGPLLMRHDCPLVGTGARVVDWRANIATHVRRLLFQIDPSGERWRRAEPLLGVCARCLVNRASAQPALAIDLIADPAFVAYRETPEKAEEVVRRWVNECC